MLYPDQWRLGGLHALLLLPSVFSHLICGFPAFRVWVSVFTVLALVSLGALDSSFDPVGRNALQHNTYSK